MVVMAHRLVLVPPQVSLSLSPGPSPSPSPSLGSYLRATVISRRCLVPRLNSGWTSSPSYMTERMSRGETRRQRKRRGLTLGGPCSQFNFRAAPACTSAYPRSAFPCALSTSHALTLLAHSPLHTLNFLLFMPLRVPPLLSPFVAPFNPTFLTLWLGICSLRPLPCRVSRFRAAPS
jgi:hypothetical protein